MNSLPQHIKHRIKPFQLSTSFEDAKTFLTKKHFSHFPIVEETVFLGNIALEDAETIENFHSLGDYRMVFEPFFARESMNWLEVLEIFSKNETNIVPVLGENNAYKGFYIYNEVAGYFNDTPFLKEPGNIFVIAKNIHDYSISQIAQIVETNNAKLIGVILSKIEDDKVQITVKSTASNINEIIQTFRRYGYEIISEHTEDNYLSELKSRSAYLDKYLNI